MNKHFCFYCMSPVNEDGSCPVCGLTAGAYQPAPHHVPPGTILLNRYLFGRVLGEGGFGITYIACDLRLDLKVAIKEYFPTDKATRHSAASLDVTSYTGTATSNYESSKRKFLSEARTMAKMDKQPEVVSVRDFFELNNTAYIVMEFVDGTDFRDLVKQQGGKIPAQQLLTTIEPLFDALSAMHAAGLVHRDISPDNLMLEHGKVRLLDFGCARESATGTDTLTIALKHGFAPIEQYTNHGQGPWTDIYALAGTIYFCITGKAPVRSTDRLLGDELIPPSKLGIELTRQQEKALLRAMAIQPRRRFQTMEEFRAALYAQEVFHEPEPDTVTQDSASVAAVTGSQIQEQTHETNTPPARKKPKNWITAIAGIVLLVLVAVIVPLTGKTPGTQLPQTSDAQTESTASSGTVSGVCGISGKWSLDLGSGVLTVSGSGNMGNYEDGEQPWYSYADAITHVVIEDDVFQVGNWAFGNLPNLKTAEIGSGVLEINPYAFANSPLTEITLSEGLRYIRHNAFSGTQLSQVEIPASVNTVDEQAFGNCPNLQKVTFLGESARLPFDRESRMFSDENNNIPEGFVLRGYTCSAVQEFALAGGYEFQAIGIGEWDVSGECGDDISFCLDLESGLLKLEGTGPMWDYNGEWMVRDHPDAWVEGLELSPWAEWLDSICCVSIGEGITSIGDNAFAFCPNLDDVRWNSTLESIGSQAFLSTNLERLVLPQSVRDIERFAFNFCGQLRYVVLPDRLDTLPCGVFNRCLSLETVYIGEQTVLEYRGFVTPFSHDEISDEGLDETLISTHMTIYCLPGSDAERFAEEYGIHFEIGYQGMIADYEGQCGDDVWYFVDEGQQTMVVYGTGSTWEFMNDSFDSPRPPYADLDCIRRVVILPGVDTLAHGLLEGMEQVTEVDFGTVRVIGAGTLLGTSVQEVRIPETVTDIYAHALSSTELTSVTIMGACNLHPAVLNFTVKLREVWLGLDVKILDNPDDGSNLFWEPHNDAYTPDDALIFYVVAGSDAERYVNQYNIGREYYTPEQ